VRDLATQNACLLLKLLHRLHHPEESAWAAWARQHTDLSTLEGANDGNHWDGLKSLLPAYRCITKVVIGDGASTTFWWDSWTEGTTLALKFPCLLSHCTQPNVSVREVCIRGLATILVPRLSPQACSEKAEVEAIIASINLQQQPDERSSKFTCTANRLDTGSIYRVSTHSGQVSMIDNFVWKSRAPPPGFGSSVGCCSMKEFSAEQTSTTSMSWMTTFANSAANPLRHVTISSSSARSLDLSGTTLDGETCLSLLSTGSGNCPGRLRCHQSSFLQ